MLSIVALACATVYEATHGTPQALATFYKSWWFQALLGLLALNALASIAARYPFNRHHIGFLLTHGSILAILVGAWITEQWGIDGQVSLTEGQAAPVRHFSISRDALMIQKRGGQAQATIELRGRAFGGFEEIEQPTTQVLSLDQVSVTVDRYVPDSEPVEQIVNDAPHEHLAVEVTVSEGGKSSRGWIFAGYPEAVGGLPVGLRIAGNQQELARLLTTAPASQPSSPGTVKVEVGGGTFEIAVEKCTAEPVPVGDSGYSVRVLRYLPNAKMGEDRKFVSVSDEPINPAIEVELTGPTGTHQRLAFARFPDLGAVHGWAGDQHVKITFLATRIEEQPLPIEIIAGPEGSLHARFWAAGDRSTTGPLTLGTPVDTPWSDTRLTVLQRFDRARSAQSVEPVTPPRQDRTPAVLLSVRTAAGTDRVWLRKYQSRPVPAGDAVYDLVYRDRSLPLGFDLRLDDFRIGTWPGTQRPRSFESRVTLFDPQAGREQSRVISMNSPTSYGGYTLFQSSYRKGQQGRADTSILSVSWDPGQPVVFAGYIGLVVGMLWVLVVRMRRTTSR